MISDKIHGTKQISRWDKIKSHEEMVDESLGLSENRLPNISEMMALHCSIRNYH